MNMPDATRPHSKKRAWATPVVRRLEASRAQNKKGNQSTDSNKNS